MYCGTLNGCSVVVSDSPEAVRTFLGDGSAWGLSLTWHLAKDGCAPYTVLRSLNYSDDDLVVIGHADQWVGERVIRLLLQREGVAMNIGQALFWTGWYSDGAKNMRAINAYDEYGHMTKRVSKLKSPCVIARLGEYAKPGDAAELLQAQSLCFDGGVIGIAPASWRRMPWGAMSPDATVSVSAKMVGPVLVGPGCVVSGSAQIGPNVVLHRNVFVSDGAEIGNAVVLQNTYVNGRVTLDRAVVQGNAVQHLKWNVRTVIDRQDAILTPLFNTDSNRTPIRSRALALLLIASLFPAFVLLAACQWVRRQPLLWRPMEVIQSRNFESGELQTTTVREPLSKDWVAGATGIYGAMIDVAQGRRRWFGLRTRDASEWYALGRDWQNLFSRSKAGFFHAPSWSQDDTTNSESRAAADAFMAVHSTFSDRLRLLLQMIRSRSA